ncbi:MAG: hypothetical protein IK061_07265, partial [Desulfovibrio sp.]|nr:hypothetical protein [Desulfovibrio sp.]
VLAGTLKERWRQGHGGTDGGRPDSFWKHMARGVMARMARGVNEAKQALEQLNKATSLGQMQNATYTNAVLRPFYNEAIHLAEKAEQAARKAQDSVYARMHERTGVPLGQLREYGALDLSAAFEAIVADLLAGRIDAKDADTVFGRAADELVEKRLRRYDDASTAQASTDVDGNTAGLWKLRVLTDKTLPKAGHMEIITICNGIDAQIARDFAAAVTEGDAPNAYWKLSVFMMQFMEACDRRGVWPDTDEQAGTLLRTAAEYLISRHNLGGKAGKADFIKALEEWKDLQKNTTIPEYLFGVAAAEQLLAAARANANAALADSVRHNRVGPDYQAVEKTVFAQVRAEFGSGPDSVRGLDKKTREEVLYPKIRQHDGPVTPQVYGAILREAILSGQRLSILAESLKSQWQAQGHDPALHPNDSYWTSMAAGVMERLARGDGTARASLAGLENAGTASAAKGAVASMQAALDHAIALAARIDAAAAAAQAHVYDTMARATGQKAEQIKGYRPLRLSDEFAPIATKILLGNT